VAFESSLRLQMPIAQANVTAIGYHAGDGAALPLQPVGRQANQGFFSRLFHRIFGGGGGGLRYYMLSGGTGPSTGVLDVGALAGTDVYSPLDGTVVGISDFILNGTKYGSRIEIQPSGAPSILVDVTHLRPDPSLTVGSTLSAGTSKIGTVIDLSQVEGQALARYTRDAGNHVSMSVHEAATLAP
jgi:murein DD-endopeptidase MepM/ murein hydrolase activator NlpD